MDTTSLKTAVRRIRSLAGPIDDSSDADLLARFRSTRDDKAFSALVARHGAAVLGVCRRVLADPHAAEDAFQATFLVLARRAKAVRKAASLGCWLHGVAFRVSSKLKGQLARRPRTTVTLDVPADPRDDVLWRDVRRVLDEEVNRLPDRLRLPVFLCYFEGKTRDEAADALGWKITTLRGRLEDGRLRLRARLALRGIELSAALLAVSAATEGLAVGDALFESTVKAAGGSVSEVVRSLANGLALSGSFAKLRLTAGVVLLALGLGSTLLVYRGQAGETPGPDPKAPAAAPKEKESPPPAAKAPKPLEWGDAVGDFRIRLHSTGPIKVGEAPELAFDVNYSGKVERNIPRREEYTEIEVDGRWFINLDKTLVEVHVDRFRPGMEWPKWITVRPNAVWGHLREKPGAAGDPGEATREVVAFRLTPGKHTVRVAYQFGKDGRAVSNPIAIEVAPDGWGESASGVKARLRIANPKLKLGEPLRFELDLRNEGVKTWILLPIPVACDARLGEERYQFYGAMHFDEPTKELKPSGELAPFLAGKVDAGWSTRRARGGDPDESERIPAERVPFRPGPGKHTVRVSFPLGEGKVRVVSNPVEIEVEAPPLDPAVKSLALVADRIWVVPSPTREKPVPSPVEVLKGPLADSGQGGLFDLQLLPADDPNKKWLVFLKADEDGKPAPEVKVWPQAPWSQPHTAELAEGIRYALQPLEWGKERDGLQMGLRLRQTTIVSGQPVVAELTIRNAGKQPKELSQHRYNIYDYWPHTIFDVTAPDGTKWILEKPEGVMKESDVPLKVTLKPGETYIHAIRLDRWLARPAHAWKEGLLPPANPFAQPGEYTIIAGYGLVRITTLVATDKTPWSNPVKLTVAKDDSKVGEWGDSANGVRGRLRLAKSNLKPGESLTFDLDLRNESAETWKINTAFFHCQLTLNNRTYYYAGSIDHPLVIKDLSPKAELVPLVSVTPDSNWHALLTNPAVPFKLTPGKHTLTVSYQVDAKTRVVTKPVEFEVAADEWGDPSNGIRGRLRLAKSKLAPGESLTFDLDVRNDGTEPRNVDASGIDCDVFLDGQRYHNVGPVDRKANVKSLRPGAELAPLVTITPDNNWGTLADPRVRFRLTPGKHTLAVSYSVDEKTRVVTKAVDFEVVADEWGTAVEGVQARLRLAKTKFKPGEPLAFELDLTNTGTQAHATRESPHLCAVELDGTEYTCVTPVAESGAARRVEPASEFVPFVIGQADARWAFTPPWTDKGGGPPDRKVFALTPGKHKVRLAYPLTDKVRPVSQVVEFEVTGDEWGEPSSGIRARVRMPKTTFKPGEPLTFEFDLKNTGTEATEGEPIPMFCRIDLDGVHYQYTAPIGYPTATLKIPPGKEYVPWVKVETNQWWTTVRNDQAVPLILTPGKHKMHVSYPLRDKVQPVSPVVEFEVADEAKGPELPALIAASDRIVVADIEFIGGVPQLTPKRTLKGPNNRWQPDVQRIDIPRGADILPGETPNDPLPGEKRSAGTWILFLKAEEDGVEVPKLTPAVLRGWYRKAEEKEVSVVVAALPKPPEGGPSLHNLSLALRPTTTTIRIGEEVRLEVVLTNTGGVDRRVLQQRYNVYDYWPFLTFTVTTPDGQEITLRKPEGVFKREDFIDEFTVKPGEDYAHAVRLDRWPNALRGRTAPGAAPREPFREPGRYTVTATYKAPDGFKNLPPDLVVKKWPFFIGELTSNPITVEVKPEVGVERRKQFDAQTDNFGLSLYRLGEPAAPDKVVGKLHLHSTPLTNEPGGLEVDRTPIGRTARITEGEAARLIAALAADGFFDRSYSGEKAHEAIGPSFLLEIWTTNAFRDRLKLAYPWTEETVRRLKKLAPCLNGKLPDLVHEIVAPLADTVPPWGKAESGLSTRLHLPAPNTLEPMELEIRNRGTHSFLYVDHPAWAEVEVDGVWYEFKVKPIDYLSSTLKPDSEPRRLRLTLDQDWVRKGAMLEKPPILAAPLSLKPGKHTIRAAYVFNPPDTKVGEPFRVISQPVEIEVPASPFDLIRPVSEPGQVPLLYLTMTVPGADHAAIEALVVKHAAAALAEADRRKFTTCNVVFLVREGVGHDRGYMSGFSREQLEEIKKATPAEARRLVGRHAWTPGKLPAGK